MKYARFILICVAVVFLGYVLFFANQDGDENSAENINREQAAKGSFETKTDEQGQVSVKVTPQILTDSTQWKFDVVFDTHSVDLNQDLVQIAILADDRGNEYQPTAWEGPGPGGHHRAGVLIFNPIKPSPRYIELKIRNLGGVIERSFRWSL